TMPINGLGKPNNSDCQVPMTRPQETHGFTSQLVTWPGFSYRASRSKTRMAEAAQPTAPVTSSTKPKVRGRAKRGTRIAGSRGPAEVPEVAGVFMVSSSGSGDG